MTRFGNNDDYEGASPMTAEMWDKIEALAFEGKPGQRQLRRLETVLINLPTKRLVCGYLAHEGDVCAIGAMGLEKMMDLGVPRDQAVDLMAERFKHINPEDGDGDSETAHFAVRHLGMTRTLAYAIARQNDSWENETPEERYEKMLEWVRSQIRPRVAA